MNLTSRAVVYTAAGASAFLLALVASTRPDIAGSVWSIFWRIALILTVVDLLVLGALEASLRGAHKKEHKQT